MDIQHLPVLSWPFPRDPINLSLQSFVPLGCITYQSLLMLCESAKSQYYWPSMQTGYILYGDGRLVTWCISSPSENWILSSQQITSIQAVSYDTEHWQRASRPIQKWLISFDRTTWTFLLARRHIIIEFRCQMDRQEWIYSLSSVLNTERIEIVPYTANCVTTQRDSLTFEFHEIFIYPGRHTFQWEFWTEVFSL